MEQRNKILIVDDTEMNRSLLADMLSDEYEIIEAADGVEAISKLEKNEGSVSLVLLDVVMPEMDGFEVLASMNKNDWIGTIPVIMISAETSFSYIDYAYDLGATDYIGRPFDEKIVRRRVKNSIMLYSKQKKLQGIVAEQIVEKGRNNYLMVEVLSNIVEFRNGESGLHVMHIRIITQMLLDALARRTKQYELSNAKIALITNASALHDIGKICVDEKILNKPGKLTPEEFEIVKTHAAVGAEILENAVHREREPLLDTAREICRWHHERFDGRGYPDGLKGDEIPVSAQVVALADVYDALTSVRVYKPAYSHAKSLEMIQNGECGAFNPILLDCLVDLGDRIEQELKIKSVGGVSVVETKQITDEIMSKGDLVVSQRSLFLLEQERIKYQFFASMSNEIQFEYNSNTEILAFSDYGAKKLGLEELIYNPKKHEGLAQAISPQNLRDFFGRLENTTKEFPLFGSEYKIRIDGEMRWTRIVARTMWTNDDLPKCVGAIGKITDIHRERTELETLRRLASRDSLTQLLNHETARQSIEALIASEHKRFVLILFDLDNFKAANDTFGHAFGDEVLRRVAQNVQNNVRGKEVAARIGGDEFLVFAEFCKEQTSPVEHLFDALTERFNQFDITVSMGVAEFNGAETYDELFRRADVALYASKRNGKNRFGFYDESIAGFGSVLSPMDSEEH